MNSYERWDQFPNGSRYPSGPGYDMHITVATYVHIEALPSNLVLMDPVTRIGRSS